MDIGGAFVKAAYWDGEGGFGPLPLLPTTVYRDLDGRLLTGSEAVRLARTAPERAEAMPARSLAEQDEMLLGGDATHPVELVAALLTRVLRDSWPGFDRTRPDALTMVVPSDLGGTDRAVLGRAIAAAGLPEPVWVPAPVAIAAGWAARREAHAGTLVAVCDAGATGLRFALASVGHAEYQPGDNIACGGADLDEALFGLVEARTRTARPEAWKRLLDCSGPEDLRARSQLREDVTGVREALSATTTVPLTVPGHREELLVRRNEFEEAAAQPLARAGTALADLMASGACPSAVLLAGGAARTPKLAELLSRSAGGLLPEVLPDPVNAAVLGAARTHKALVATGGGEAPYAFPEDEDLFR
ncbi:Hsp70 family protein [Streptomyces sp. JJ38]|uniref:Hsp70 family protein n=1 Tax=Streptomyces sp. JJ38 TaxID=2738128 RepID=UPI001C599D27|nr:Hsp70 family protein [Streptomyces sp. JJ38]MBW1597397.1 Hsp70 family protein [Streptomyces sp. JJ38]